MSIVKLTKKPAENSFPQSVCALLSHGIDSVLAARLIQQNYNLSKLKGLKKKNLLKLAISDDVADQILQERRPLIPIDVVVRLLHSSKYVCCVCRDSSKGVIIHHIEKWEKSRSHKKGNLAVLCLQHHNEAHSKHELIRNLTPTIIRKLKTKWEQKVAELDSSVLAEKANFADANWDYFNHARLFKIATKLGLNLHLNQYFRSVYQLGIVSNQGLLLEQNRWINQPDNSSYLYAFGNGIILYNYVSSVLEEVIRKLKIIDITKLWCRRQINALVREGDWIECQGAFYFRKLKGVQQGKH
jgi:hypothetical protein